MRDDEIKEAIGRIEEMVKTFNEQAEHNAKFVESFGMGFTMALTAICEALIASNAVKRDDLINWIAEADRVMVEKAKETGIVQEADVHRKAFAYMIDFLRERTIPRH